MMDAKLYCDGSEHKKNRVAVYRCTSCGSVFCRKCFDDFGGECEYCEPPYLEKITQPKEK